MRAGLSSEETDMMASVKMMIRAKVPVEFQISISEKCMAVEALLHERGGVTAI